MKAFVLMPFDPEFDAVYERLIQPALAEAGYAVARADTELHQQNVMKGIVQEISTADLLIAELTGSNPNVLYELGLAHGLGIPTVLIAQDIGEIPFDLRNYRVLVYSTRFDEIGNLSAALASIAREHVAGTVVFGSPVADFLPGTQMARTDSSSSVSAPLGPDEPAGLLDRIVEMDEAQAEFLEVTSRIAQATEDVGEDVRRSGERIDDVDLTAPGAVVRVRRLASAAASDLTRYAVRVEADLPDMESAVEKFVENGLGHFTWLAEQQDEQLFEQREDMKRELSALSEATDQSLRQMKEFRDSVLSVKDVSRELDKAVDRVAAALREVILLIARMRSFADEGASVLDVELTE